MNISLKKGEKKMKKILCCLLMFCLMSTVIGGVLAEETSESAYDAFLLKKGVLISKEYIKERTVDAKSSGGYDYPIDLKNCHFNGYRDEGDLQVSADVS